MEPTFTHSIYWFFMQKPVILFSIGLTTFVVAVIGLFTVFKRWGD